MIITIDGPTASGKSTVALILAQHLSYYYLNSGFLYRALAYIYKTNNFTEEDLKKLFESQQLMYIYTPELGVKILYDNVEITHQLKDASIDKKASIIATNPIIRKAILDFMRSYINKYDIVADGRDCGTIVFPQADYKFFLTASLEVRAYRWQQDQNKKNNNYTVEQSLDILRDRDLRDSTRTISPLIPAKDAIIIDNSNLNIKQTVDTLINIIK